MISSLLFLTLQAAAQKPMEPVVLQQATTGAAIRLDLPEYLSDDTVIGSLRRRFADRAIAQGKLRGDGTIMVVSAYGEMQPSAEWRKALMVGKLLGLGQFDVGTTACTEATRELEPPYVALSWHAFPTFADTCYDITIGTLAKDGVSPITRADFEHIVQSARYGIVRLGKWEDMPSAVMEHMHAGLSRAANDGATFLAEKSKAAPEDWALALAAAEIGMRAKMPAPDRHALFERALAGLAKTDRLNAGDMFATMTAQSGLALALRDEGKHDDALAMLAKTQIFECAKTKPATAALEYYAATIHALKLDATAAIEHLKLSIAADPERKSFATRDPSFQGIGTNQDLIKLLKPPKQ
jgi:tetratricopeptide (TPR) repeat protein